MLTPATVSFSRPSALTSDTNEDFGLMHPNLPPSHVLGTTNQYLHTSNQCYGVNMEAAFSS